MKDTASRLALPAILALLLLGACVPSASSPVLPAPAALVPTVSTTTASAPVGDLSPDTLKNLTYNSTYTRSHLAPLDNGVYTEPAAPGSATKLLVRLTDYTAYGQLNGQDAVAVVLSADPGGSGTFYDLAVVMDQNGSPVNVATVDLGDRIKLHTLSIQDGHIVVDMIAPDAGDPMCCPSKHLIKQYVLEGDQLLQTESEPVVAKN